MNVRQLLKVISDFPQLWSIRQDTRHFLDLVVVNAERVDLFSKSIVIPLDWNTPNLYVFNEVWIHVKSLKHGHELVENVTPTQKCGLASAILDSVSRIRQGDEYFGEFSIETVFLLRHTNTEGKRLYVYAKAVRKPKKTDFISYLATSQELFDRYLQELQESIDVYSGVKN